MNSPRTGNGYTGGQKPNGKKLWYVVFTSAIASAINGRTRTEYRGTGGAKKR